MYTISILFGYAAIQRQKWLYDICLEHSSQV